MRSLQRRTLIHAAARLLVLAGCGLGVAAGLRMGGLSSRAQGVGVAAGAREHPGAGGAAPAPARPRGVAGSLRSAGAGAPGPDRPDAIPGPGGAGPAEVGVPAGGAADGAGSAGFRASARGAEGDREHEPRIASLGVIVLDGFDAAPGAVSGALLGFDPGGPRALVLWRIGDGAAMRLADGFSDSAGELHFPQVAQPGDPLDLVVAPAGAPPPSRDASDPEHVAGRAPLAPVVEQVRPEAGSVVLRIGAREATGVVLVAAGDGTLLGRFSLPALTGPAARTLEIAVDGPVRSGGLLVAHELPDGRRSPFEPVALPAGTGGTP